MCLTSMSPLTSYKEMERYTEARSLMIEALDIYRRGHAAEPDHPDVVAALNNLAALECEIDRPIECELLLVEAYMACRRFYAGEWV
jgi:hypothetical protein